MSVWGGRPSRTGPITGAIRAAVARRRALSALRRRGARVHVLPPSLLRPGGRALASRWLHEGAIVELRPGRAERVIDTVARDAGLADEVARFRASAAGGIVAEVRTRNGERAILRAAGSGWPGDPSSAAEALEALEGHEVPAPQLIGRGSAAGASWTLERFVPGHRPRRLDQRIGGSIARIAARLPRSGARPDAVLRDLERVAAALPRHAEAVASLRDRVVSTRAPAIMRHGDLWLGHLLVGDGGPFILDWEGWAPDGMPGADLLHLVATERRIAQRTDMGAVWRARPWRDETFLRLAEPYWTAIGWEPGAGEDDVVGVAWWAAEVAGTLARVPERAEDARWVSINVEGVLARSRD